MDIDGHGGGCCGIYHLSCFDEEHDADEMSFKERVAAIEEYIRNIQAGRMIEAVLARHRYSPSDNQFKHWERPLQKLGFRKKTEFVNSNTGNTIRVYHLVK